MMLSCVIGLLLNEAYQYTQGFIRLAQPFYQSLDTLNFQNTLLHAFSTRTVTSYQLMLSLLFHQL